MPLDDAARQQLQAEAGIASGQPGALLETQPPPDPQPAWLLDEQGLVVCLPDPLQVQGCNLSTDLWSSCDHCAGRYRHSGTVYRKGSHLPTYLQGDWGPPRRPLWDGTDYLRTQRGAAGTGGLTALVRCRVCAVQLSE